MIDMALSLAWLLVFPLAAVLQRDMTPAYRDALRQAMVGSAFNRQDGWSIPTGASARFMTHGRWFNTIRSLERYCRAQRSTFTSD